MKEGNRNRGTLAIVTGVGVSFPTFFPLQVRENSINEHIKCIF